MSSMWQRNIRAREFLELFFVTSVASVLIIRFYLHVTGYPQIGGDGLHIAHMLWGGAFMLAALVITMAFLGDRILKISAILGGIGFGTFIDELGKFITRDNDYFFQPTIALIYLTFVLLFLFFRFLGYKETYTDKEYLLNGLFALEEAIVNDMDSKEKAQALRYLNNTKNDALGKNLYDIVAQLKPATTEKSSYAHKIREQLRKYYYRFILRPRYLRFIRWFFIAEAGLIILSVGLVIVLTLINAPSRVNTIEPSEIWIAIGHLVSAVTSAVLIVAGVVSLPGSRLRAYEWFIRATLVNILLVQFFQFYREEFSALPELLFNIAMLVLLRYAVREERRLALSR